MKRLLDWTRPVKGVARRTPRLARRLPDLWYPRLWSAWLLFSGVSFAALETNALKVQPRCHRDSLSANLQWWLCRTRSRRTVSAVGWVTFALWFLDHIWLSEGAYAP